MRLRSLRRATMRLARRLGGNERVALIPEDEERRVQLAAATRWGVSPAVHPRDFLYREVLENPVFAEPAHAVIYYFDDGADSARLLGETLSGPCGLERNPIRLLEFASGYGRVTRHILRDLPWCEVTACDIHEEAVEFVRKEVGVPTLLSASAPADFSPGASFDVVFALSFFSHMPKTSFADWIDALVGCVRPGGHLIFTTHGLVSEQYFPNFEYDADGFYFATVSDQGDLEGEVYGSSIVKPEAVMSRIARGTDRRLKTFSEAYWWGHQDLYVVRKLPVDPAS